MKIKIKKPIILGIAIAVVLVVVGTVGALNGWFGGGSSIPSDTMTRGLMGYWGFDEQTGPLIMDKSGNGNDGMINDGGSGNPVSYWTFDEGTGQTAYDYTGSNNGTLGTTTAVSSDDPTWTPNGRVGGALQFDAVDDTVVVPAVSFSVYSFFFWLKPASTITATSPGQQKFDFGGSQAIVTGSCTGYLSNETFCVFGPGDRRTCVINVNIDTSWHFIGIVWNAGASRYDVYFDNVLQSVSSGGGGAVQLIAATLFTMGGQVDGLLDDVRIYNYVRAATQIQRDYQETYKTKFAAGKVGDAMQFDGVDDYVDVGNGASVNIGTSDFTLEAWINMTAEAGYQTILYKGSNPGYNWMIQPTSNLARLEFGDGTGYIAGFSTTPVTGAWHFLAVTADRDSLATFYLDGNPDGTFNVSSKQGSLVNDLSLTVAKYAGYWGKGLIDEVRIYNRALSKEEVRYHYSRGGPVAEWKFDEGQGQTAFDSTGNNNDGQIGSTTAVDAADPIWTKGKYGTALSFDGVNDYVSVTDQASLGGMSELTVGAWINRPNVNTNMPVLGKRQYGEAYDLYIVSTGVIQFCQANDTPSWACYNTSALSWNSNQWYYIVGVWKSGQSPNIYRDGVLISSSYFNGNTGGSPVGGTIQDNNYNLNIGSRVPDGIYANGTIDDVRIYNYVRTADEIRLDYNAGFGVRFGGSPAEDMTRGLVGYWSFDESSGPLLSDKSGMGNDGMINDGGSGNPVAYWTFDEGTGQTAYDYTGSNNGTLGASASPALDDPQWSSSGRVGGALSFDGVNDYVNAGNGASLNVTTFTAEAWIKPDKVDQNDIVAKYDGGGLRSWFMMVVSGQLRGHVVNTGSTVFTATGGTITVGNWYHVVQVFSSPTITMYVNGVFVAAADITGTIQTDVDNKVYIGSRNGSTGEVYNNRGLIDDVRIYNYARGAAQIQRDYQETYKTKFAAGAPAANGGSQGNALQFDGVDDNVNCGSGASLDISDNISVEFWMKISGWSDQNSMFPIEKGPVHDNHFTFYVDGSQQPAGLVVYANAGGVWQAVSGFKGGLVLDTWYYVAWAYQNGGTLYVDGVQVGVKTGSGVLKITPEPLLIGGKSWAGVGYNYFFNGSIDEVRIYNRALSVEEIRYHYNRGGPVAYWRFDEGNGTTTYDSTNNSNDGQLGGGTTAYVPTWTTGKYGSALSFDGADDYVKVSNNSNLNPTTLTLGMWVYFNSLSGEPCPLQKGATFANPGYAITINNSHVRFNIGRTGGESLLDSQTTLTTSQWYYIVATYDGTTQRIYINGVKDSNEAKPPSYETSNEELWIGTNKRQPTLTFPVNGKIDEVRIYNYARTQEQIRLDYNEGLAVRFGPTPMSPAGCDLDPAGCMSKGLVGSWSMDEGDGGYIYDKSDYKNTGYVGPTGKALSFDGGDKVSIPIVLSPPYTLMLWGKLNALPSVLVAQEFFTDGSTANTAAFGYDNTDQLYFNNGSVIYWGYPSSVTILSWHMYTVVVNGASSSITLDGGTPVTGTLANTSITTLLLGENGNGSVHLTGVMDEVRIYNRALSATEIAEHYKGIFSNKTGLVGYWPFSEGSGSIAYDKSGNGNNGTLGVAANMPTWKNNAPKYTAGAPAANGGTQGTALQFDGVDDYVDAGNGASLNFSGTKPFTITAWIKPNAVTAGKIVNRFNSGVAGNYFFGLFNGVLQLGRSVSPWQIFGSTTLSASTWYHVVGSYDGSKMYVYLNGVSDATPVTIGSVADAAINVFIGSSQVSNNPSEFFNGLIDEVRIYNRALSVEEIRYHYNKGGPVAYWKFDEGQGQVAFDSTNNNNDGTLGSSASADAGDPVWTTGKYGSALQFDGVDDYVNVPDSDNWNYSNNNFTIEWWMKLAVTNTYQGVYGQYADTNNRVQAWYYGGSDGSIRFYAGSGGTAITYFYTGAWSPTANTWHHIVIERNGNSPLIFIDGISQTVTELTPIAGKTLPNIAANLKIGYDGSDYHFNGSIDDVRIYNYARTQAQILQDYNAGLSTYFK